MTPLSEFINLLAKSAEDNCDLDSPVSLKELSAGDSLYAELGAGYSAAVYYDKSTIKVIPVLFLCRNADQGRCLGQLEEICNYFQRLKQYPKGKSFSWLDTEIAKEPSRIGRDEDGRYHYSCILNNKIYF